MDAESNIDAELLADENTVVVAPTRTEQLEQALALAREFIADLERRHAAAEMAWLEQSHELQDRILWLEGIVSSNVVSASKRTRG